MSNAGQNIHITYLLPAGLNSLTLHIIGTWRRSKDWRGSTISTISEDGLRHNSFNISWHNISFGQQEYQEELTSTGCLKDILRIIYGKFT